MTRLGRNELSLGRFVTPEEVVEKITAVTRGQVQELAQNYLHQKNLLLLQ